MGALIAIAEFVLKLLGFVRGAPAPSAQEKLGQAETAAQSQEAARAEVSQAVDARRGADVVRLRRTGTGTVTADAGAGVNRDDGYRRD